MRYFIILSFMFISPAWADENSTEKPTQISLSASSSITLPNDEVVLNYRMEATGKHANVLRKKVNNISRLIHQQLKGRKDVKQTTLSRRMEMIWRYDKMKGRQVRDGWKLVQQEQLISHNLAAVPEWVDGIEKAGAHLNALSFRISDTSMKAAQNSLRLQALQTFRKKATSIAKALNATSFSIVRLQTGLQRPRPIRRDMPMMAMMKSESAGSPPPSLNTGEGKVSVTVSGNIALPFKSYVVK